MKLKVNLEIDEWEHKDKTRFIAINYQILNPLKEMPEKSRDYIINSLAPYLMKFNPEMRSMEDICNETLGPEALDMGYSFEKVYKRAAATLAYRAKSLEANIVQLTSDVNQVYRAKRFPEGRPDRNILIYTRPLTTDELRILGDEVMSLLEGN